MGELLAIGSAVAWALTSVAMRPIVGRALWRSSLLRMLVCAGLLGIYAWPSGALSRALEAPSGAWLWLLGSTLCSMAIGDSLYFLAAARIGVARALPIASSFPLLTTLGAVVLLNEALTVQLVLGSALVVLAVDLIGVNARAAADATTSSAWCWPAWPRACGQAWDSSSAQLCACSTRSPRT